MTRRTTLLLSAMVATGFGISIFGMVSADTASELSAWIITLVCVILYAFIPCTE